ncbi:RNA polymerase sigma factor [Conexibacter sp. CPCC 206217]|uniref:RNA polymerase sigma factor n=1 Tax=Conexibacter sp. CPCC 206217 TaxID=3064574 RepID=UPI002723D2D3|nr:sigma-70 family RNA polymerase sigma factor [Conexibacter sp. CPCC 206217]MDO8209481.1 sigma-70 family RNA polymerase sigma factor [Conexibacter sp. CPCC 206217]
MRLRSDEQLVKLFRQGNEDAFRAIHDRYRARLFAYTRQMLSGSRQDAEDALQDVFVRAYGALRANDREVSLRAWLYRVAHNRCIDELRRPAPPPPEMFDQIRPPESDPIAETEQRESLRRLVEDVRRLPEQQRSALLMREIVGMSYADLAAALDVTVPAVKSLLVRARMGLAQAAEARDTACVEIREELVGAHDRGVRASGLARRHLHDCAGCRAYKRELKTMRERFAALTPALGPVAVLAKLLGIGGGGAAAGSTAAAGGGAGAAAGGAAAVAGGAAAGGTVVTAGHVAAVVAAAVVAGGGAVEVKRTLSPPSSKPAAIVVRVPRPKQEPLLAAAASVQARPAAASAPSTAGASATVRDSRPAGAAATAKAVKLRASHEPSGTVVSIVRPSVPADAVVSKGSGNGGAAAPSDELIADEPTTVTDPATPDGTATTEPTTGTGTSTTPTTTAPTTAAPPPATGTASGPTGSTPPAGAGSTPAAPSTPAAGAPQPPATPSTTGGAGSTPANTLPPGG